MSWNKVRGNQTYITFKTARYAQSYERGKGYLLRVCGIVSRAALTHIGTFSINTNLRASAIVHGAFINICTACLVVGCNVTLVALTTKTGRINKKWLKMIQNIFPII